MLGRGMVANPGLALAIRGEQMAMAWADLLPLMRDFFAQVRINVQPKHQAGRLKQWLHYLRRHYPEADEAYQRLRTVNAPEELARSLFAELRDQPVLLAA